MNSPTKECYITMGRKKLNLSTGELENKSFSEKTYHNLGRLPNLNI